MVGMPPVSAESRAEAEAWISRGQTLEDRGELAGALDCYRQAVLCTPEFPRAHLNIGNALRGMHRTDEARAAFGEAIRLDPNYAHGHFNLALLCSVVADFPTARAELQEVMRLQPDLVARVLDAESFILFASGLRGDMDPETLAREHFRVGKAIAEASAPATIIGTILQIRLENCALATFPPTSGSIRSLYFCARYSSVMITRVSPSTAIQTRRRGYRLIRAFNNCLLGGKSGS
jgi:tetratricopeptide (TPR) repeat protein